MDPGEMPKGSSERGALREGVEGAEKRPVGRLLLVDDEATVRSALARALGAAGHEVRTAASPEEALRAVESESFDVVLTDVHMPSGTALDLLQALRQRANDAPVIFLTGKPSADTAARALEDGAFRYLFKPVPTEKLLETVSAALKASATRARGAADQERERLGQAFRNILDTLWVAFQPIVSVEQREVVAYETLMRASEPSLPHPGAVFAAAETLGQLHVLGRTIRERVTSAIAAAGPGSMFFVNVHPTDLVDPELLDPRAPMNRYARQIVLELTERAALDSIPALDERLAKLRELGFRIAVDDLGAGYSGLSHFATVRPEVVKIDMSLIRGIDQDLVKQRVVLALASLSRSLGIEVVGEGVETVPERDMLVKLRCSHLQGYLFAKPAASFPPASWT